MPPSRTEDSIENSEHDKNEDEEKRRETPDIGPVPGAALKLPLCRLHDRLDAGIDSFREFALPELRRDDAAYDLVAEGVGEHAFESVSDFDPHEAVILGDDQKDPVIPSLFPELVPFRDPHRIVLDALPVQGRDDQDGDLVGGCLFEFREGTFEIPRLPLGERPGQIGDPAVKFRDGKLVLPGARGTGRKREKEYCKKENGFHAQNVTFGTFSAPGSAWK